MKTRTLLLLALGCGLAIMLAGAVLLFQLSTSDDVAAPVVIGDQVVVGDMAVVVIDAVEDGGRLTVDVEIGGVDDPDGADAFRLIASGRPLSPVDESADDSCSVTTTSVAKCTVVFDVGGADGSSRVLFYERGDDQARWVLG
jgi:hypothetical protein